MNKITFEGVDLELERVPCRVCGEEDQRPFMTEMRHGLDLSTVICTNCGLFYSSPRFTDKATAIFYERLYPAFHGRTDGVTEEWQAKTKKDGEPRVKTLEEFLPKDADATVVEIGSGGGGFLTAATARTNWKLIGIEPGIQQVEHMRARGLDVRHTPFEEVDFTELAPRAIVLFHVFEHLNHPMDFLAAARAALPEDGILYLEVPDLAHSTTRLREFLQAPHVYNFTSITLRNTLRLGGFEVRWLRERGNRLSMIATPGPVGQLEKWDIDAFVSRLRERERVLRAAELIPAKSVLRKVRGIIASV